MRAPQFFRISTGHRAESRPLASPISPQISFMWEQRCEASYNRSLSLRPSGSLATLADRTSRDLCLYRPTVAYYVPARWPRVTPRPVGYATAPN